MGEGERLLEAMPAGRRRRRERRRRQLNPAPETPPQIKEPFCSRTFLNHSAQPD